MPVIDNFGTGTKAESSSSVWSDWGTVSDWSISNTNNASAPSGSPEAYFDPPSGSTITRVDYTGSQSPTPGSVLIYFYPTNIAGQRRFKLLGYQFESIGSIRFGSGGGISGRGYAGGPDTGTYSANTAYKLAFTNIDWSNNTFDYEVTEVATGNVVASGGTFDFAGNAQYLTQISVSTTSIAPLYFDEPAYFVPSAAPTNLSASASGDDINLGWTDNGPNEDGFRIYRAQSSGSSLSDYSQIAQVGANTTTYTDTALEDGERYYYRVTAFNPSGETSPTNEAAATTALPAPTVDGLTYVADDQLDFQFTPNDDHGDPNYSVQMSRDGSTYSDPASGNANVGSGGTYSYLPASDSAYDQQVGIDSSFQFRVRAESEHTSSGWTTSGTVYTRPIPPHTPSVSRPTENSISITWTTKSDVVSEVNAQYRVDDGTGFSAWQALSANPIASGDTISLTSNRRYQFRIRSEGPNGKVSPWVYTDYGNENGVIFTDDFEDQDFAEWTSTSGAVIASGTDPNSSDTGISGAEQGTYYAAFDASGSIQKNLGDLSGQSDIMVKFYMANGSMDAASEDTLIDWYDGSTWQNLVGHSHEYNKQGWVEVTALVPNSYLSTDNRVRFRGSSGLGGGDQHAFDRVVVADVLDEYTAPVAPSALSASGTSNRFEVTASWTVNIADLPQAFQELRIRVNGSGNTFDKENVNLQSSATKDVNTGFNTSVPRRDGELYEVRVDSLFHQFRRGSTVSYPRAETGTTTALTVLPAPTDLSASNVTADQADLTWTDNHNYGDTQVQFKRSSDGSYTQDATLAIGDETYTLTGLLDGEQYDARVIAATEHTTTVDN